MQKALEYVGVMPDSELILVPPREPFHVQRRLTESWKEVDKLRAEMQEEIHNRKHIMDDIRVKQQAIAEQEEIITNYVKFQHQYEKEMLEAREKIEDPYREEEPEEVKANPAAASSVQDIPADFRLMKPKEREQLKLSIGDLPDDIKKKFLDDFRKEFDVKTPKVFNAIQEVRHLTWIQNNFPVVK